MSFNQFTQEAEKLNIDLKNLSSLITSIAYLDEDEKKQVCFELNQLSKNELFFRFDRCNQLDACFKQKVLDYSLITSFYQDILEDFEFLTPLHIYSSLEGLKAEKNNVLNLIKKYD